MRTPRSHVLDGADARRTTAGVPPAPPEGSPKATLSGLSDSAFMLTQGRDVREHVCGRLAAMLGQGPAVFQKCCAKAASQGLPRNGWTQRFYRGVNVFLLCEALAERGYGANVWLTRWQAQRLGAGVRRGESGVMALRPGRRGVAQGGQGVLPFWLFNIAQFDGLPVWLLQRCSVQPTDEVRPPLERAVRLLTGSNAIIRHGYEPAVYVRQRDEIRLPWPRRFSGAPAYCAAALRQLVHWSGHPERLNRSVDAVAGSACNDVEALVAHLASALLLGCCGLADAFVEDEAAWRGAVARVQERDGGALLRAAALATEAVEFIRSFDEESSR